MTATAFSGRHLQKSLLLLSLAAIELHGCSHLPRHKARKAEEEAAQCLAAQQQIARRFFISSQGRMGVNGQAGSFARELTASINAIPNCTAIMLPLDFPVDAPPGQEPGPSPQLLQFIHSAGPSDAIDEVLIVHVTDVVDFRPMRISAVLERRTVGDGVVIARDHRTWNAPVDNQPLSPSRLNRFILNHPPAAAVVEQMELSRLSPQTFQRTVAEGLAQELSVSPL